MHLQRWIKRPRFWQAVGFAVLLFTLAAILHFRISKFADLDILYHFTHARIYAQRGPFYTEFPWASRSVISVYHGDIWWGYHLCLIPFTFIPDPYVAVKVAGVFVLALSLIVYTYACWKAKLVLPFLWPLVLLTMSEGELWRLCMIRPQVPSLALLVLLLVFLSRGDAKGAAVTGFTISLIHQTLSWMVPIVAAPVFISALIAQKRWAWRETAAALLGAALPWLIHPNPIGTMKVMYVQLVQLTLERRAGVPLAFGTELGAAHINFIKVNFPAFLVLWGLAAALLMLRVFYARRDIDAKAWTMLMSSFGLSLLLLAMSLKLSLRSVDHWAGFTVLFIGLSTTYCFWPLFKQRAWVRHLATAGLLVTIFFMGWVANKFNISDLNRSGFDGVRMREPMAWLKAHSPKGSVVFHTAWPLFGELFFWNQHNRFLGGMDPIFQYAYNPRYYWELHHLANRDGSQSTWAQPPGQKPKPEDTYSVIRRDFDADYMVVVKSKNPQLFRYAQVDRRFQLVYDGNGIAIFGLVGD